MPPGKASRSDGHVRTNLLSNRFGDAALLLHNARNDAWSFHPERPELIAAVNSRQLTRWDLEQGRELARQAVEITPTQLKYSPDGHRVAAAYRLAHGSDEDIGRDDSPGAS